MGYILAGVGNIQLLDGPSGNLILTSKTLTESGITVGVTGEDIRGGLSAPLIGKYFHTSTMDLNLVDAVFSMEYLALNVGGNITIGGEAIGEESITTTVANSITVTGTPLVWNGMTDIVGWYTIAGANNWKKITFVGKTATVTDLPIGTNVCVRYNQTNDAMRQFIVPSAIVPAECYAILTAPLFQADSKNFTSSSQVGTLVVEIPRFQLSGAQDFGMTMTGATTTNLAGSALVSFSGAETCTEGGYYAKLKEIITGKQWYDGLVTMAVDGADIQLSVAGSETLSVIGLYEGGATGTIKNSNLTFTSGTESTATVDNTGKITAVAAGTSLIKIVATDKNTIEAYAQVTVS